MSSPSNPPSPDRVRRLVAELLLAVAAVGVTVAIVFNERLVVERRHAPLSETAASMAADQSETTATTAVASEAGGRP